MEEHSSTVAVLRDDGTRSAGSLRLRAPASAAFEGSKNLLKIGMRENNSSTSEHPSSGAPMASAPHPHRSISFVHRLMLPVLLLTSLVHSPDLGIAASAVPSDAADAPAGPGGEFEIEWAQAPVPARLRRGEMLVDGGLDAQGTRMALGVPVSLAHGDGRLFLASNSEPSVFGRDPAGGGLAFERVSAGVSDDHGDDLSTATPVAIPSNTDGEITRGGDRDYFRIDVAEAGIVSFETTGSTDTFGTLYDSDGTVIGQDDESGPGPNNFRLADVVLFERTYFLEVRGYSSRTEGEYRMRVSGDARGTMTPVATAPSVSIDAIPSGNESTTVRLGATLSGGAYDGAVEYAWTVDGGVLDSASSATPTWTRPSVAANTNHRVLLTVTVRGTGTNAESGTSDTASASRDAFVSSVAPALPVADAPAVSINPIPAGNEGATVRLGAALTGGTYDGGVEYAWTVDDGTIDNAGSATPTWARPSVDSNTNHTVRLTITVRGSGANARNGTSDTASTSRTALVRNVAVALPAADAPSVSINAIADGDEATTVQLGANVTGGTYDGAVAYDWSVNGGTLNDPSLATPTWTRPTVSANADYTASLTITVRGTGTSARNGSSDTASTNASATVRDIPRLTVTTLASNLTIPWDLDFTPDGTMLFTERGGKLSARLTDGTVQAVTAALGDVYAVGESGLMAIVTDPDFTTNRRFYTCQAHTGPEVQVIAWTIDSGYTAATRAADPLVGGIPAKAGSGRHSGCRLRFGPDGHLWIATGDAAIGSTPQDMNSLGGKVLRVNPSTGAGVSGNPFAAAPRIYSFGHRNIQGLAPRPGTRQMWVVEHGPNTDDEINLLASGGNYGWDPTRPGSTYYEGVPMTDLTKFPGAVPAKWSSGRPTLATSGGVFLEGAGWRGWEGRLAVASLKDRSLRLFEFSPGGDFVSQVYVSRLSNSYGRLRTPMLGPDGALYLTTSNGSAADRILRVGAGDGTSVQRADAAAPSVSIDAIADGDENTTVQFSAALTSGIYDGAVEYDWSVSGGTLDDHTAAAPTWTRPAVSSDTSHTVNLTVTVNGTGSKAVNGTSDTANATASTLVRDAGGTGRDHGNDRASATTVAIPSTTAGTLDAGDEDFFRIDIGQAGSLTLESSGTTDTYGILYDSDGAELARDNDGGTGQNFRIFRESLAPGTYYLLLRAFDPAVSGDYSLTVSGSAQPPGSDAFQSESASAEEASSTADDHGNDPATATVVAIPSTTAGELGTGDKDYFRIDVVVAGFLTFETTGSTDTYGTLYDSDGAVIDEDNDRGPRPNNFRITDALVLEGSYFLEVRGASPSRDTGPYELRMTGDARGPGTPAATAPSVSIHAIPSGDEETTVQLGATLTGGAYDGAVDYAWSVDGGTLDSSSSATPIWTRPAVDSNTNHTVRLTVTVRGTGTNAESGTSDSAGANRQALVRDVPPPLPAADAPSVTINTIPNGNENTTVRLGATLTGGTYDGTPEFTWTVTGGRLSNPNSATPTWTRPNLNADADYTVRLTVTVRGRGTNARSGTSERVNANQTARVLDVPVQLPVAAAPSVSINAVPAGNEGTAVQLGATLNGGTYDGALDYAWTVTGGTLDNANLATPTWTRPSVASNTNYTVRLTITARGTGTTARNGTSDTANTSRSAQVRNVVAPLPVAAAPSVSIDAIPAGNENTTVQLSATLNGGTYDGAVDYAWTVTGGTLDDPAATTPTWTRPSVTSNTNFTVRLTVTARGDGSVARNGSSDTANTTFSALVRNVVVVLPVAAAPSVTINAIPAGDENTNVQLAATLNGGTYDGSVEYAWSVNGGTLDSSSSATPTWARPSVTSNTNHTVSLTITVRGSGTVARNGTSDTASTTRTAQVRNVGGTGGDHGNNRASATTVGIPSTTAGKITVGDRDYFRIDVSQAGSLRLQTSGTTDTWGTLFDSGGSKIREDDDAGPGRNFRIFQGSVDVGTYYVEVRGWSLRSTTGDYSLEVSGDARSTGTQLPAASAPSVSINSIPAGDEGTAVQLGATLAGGTYDGAVDYTWSVSGGTLDNANLAAPTWTRPAVNADANHTVSLTVSVDGSGTNASNGTSDTASTSRTAQVQDVPLQLPPAAAPSVSINTIPAGNEGTDVQLSAALGSGTHDGAVEYQWSVDGGVLDNANAATPTWTRPSVTSNTNHTVSLTITVRGTGTTARNGTSDTANTSRSAQVRNVVVLLPAASAPTVTINAVPAGNENTAVQLGATLSGGGTYDGAVEYNWSVNGGTLDNANSATPNWTRPSVSSDSSRTVSLTVTVRGTGTAARNGTSDTASNSLTAQVRDAGDHGNDQASATRVAIPSTTTGTLTSRDRDYFRIEVGQAGSLRLETTSGLDTYGTLLRSDGSQVARNDDSGSNYNFRISMGSIGAGVYYLQVRGFHHTTTGPYNLEVSGTARGPGGLPAASAPTVSIDSIPAGDEGTAVQLAAAVVGGTYDGAVDYTWSVSGGVLDNANLAAPTWTRPAVNADTNHTISLTVSVDGSGTNASSGTSDTASTSRSAQVRNVVLLPVAAAPTVSIDAIPAGNENTNVQLGVTLNGGTYDGTVDYAWTATGGTLNDPAAATPTWTRPSVASNTNYTVRLTVTARGSGTVARNGTSDTANATRTTQVRNVVVLPVAAAPSVTINAISAGDEGTAVQLGSTLTGGGPYDGAVEYDWSVNGGTLDNANSATPNWTRPSVASDTNRTVSLTITVRGTGATARNGTSDTANATRTTQVRNVVVLPVAAAPSVTINAIPAGKEGTAVQLGATLTGGGPYDGAVEYDWSVNGGTLDNANSATPNWTRPSVTSDTNRTVSLTITVRGTGATARNGTSDTASTSRDALVRNDTGTLPAATAPAVSINAIANGDEATRVQLGAALTGGDYDGTPEYAWSVTGGTLADPNSATPTWTRPRVASNTNHTVRLTVTVRGTGTAALDGTSDTQSANRSTQVRDTGGTGDDHGNTRADATLVTVPSTTTANLGRNDRDYYRIEVGHAGSLRLQTRGHIDTVGTLRRSNGSAIASNDDGGERQNFHIFRNSVGVGTFYLEVRGYSNASRGDYKLEVTGTARGADSLPSAAAPSVTINTIADGDEGTNVQLGAALTGGIYDGAVEYDWSVDGGTLNDPSLATPTWTRPAVTSDTNHTASLIVTVQGSGTRAASGTSATANASRTTLVRNVTTALPVAAAPAVTINAIPAGDEGSTVQLGAALSGGTYDGAVDYAWTATGGTLANADTATPTWTRPTVGATANYTLRLTVTVNGTGTVARNGTSATANTSRTAQVRNLVQLPVAAAPTVTIDAIPAGDEGTDVQLGANVTGGTYDGAVAYDWSVNGGTLNDPSLATPTWTRPTVSANADYTASLTITVRGTGTSARNGSSDTASTNASATVRDIPRLTVTTLASNLTIPWDLDFTPDGTMLFTERGGKLSARLTDGTVQAVTAALGDVYAVGESGLMAIVTDPDFTTNRRFYTCQAHTGPEVQVIAWTIDSGYTAATRAADPLVGGIPAKAGSGRHSGCRLRFGPDGHLWIATGDAAIGSTPQDMNSLGGKVLRVNPSTGAGVSGNPFAAAPRIYSFGHRNIQGLAPRPGTRQMWVVEHGPNTDDEINLLASGGNYGWDPTRPGSTYYEGVPMTDLTKFPGAVPAKWSSGRPTLATSGGVFLEGAGWRGWEGRLAVASLKDRSLRLFEFSPGGDFVSQVYVSRLSNSYGRLRTPMLGPDGALYLTTSNGSAADRILRVGAGDGTSVQRADAAAPSVSIDAIADGDENTTVQFSAALTSGIYDGAVEYDWSVSDGMFILLDDTTAAAPTWTRPVVSSDTTYTVSLTVTVNGAGTNAVNGTSDTVTATTSTLVRPLPVAAAPSVSINAIADGNEGTTVQLGAAVTGGTYDGAVEYDWSVNGGTLDDDSIASPTWTRPTINANANYTASLTVTVRGSGTNARHGTSATASATRSALVQNVTPTLPSAVAPSVSINAIAAGDEGTDVQLSATVTGGTYDTGVDYEWRVVAGLLDDATSPTPTWTRPSSALPNTHFMVQLTASVGGSGTKARDGTSATTRVNRMALVRNTGPDDHGDDIASATTVQLPSTTSARLDPGDMDYFRINIVRAGTLRLKTTGSVDTYGKLYNSSGIKIAEQDDGGGDSNGNGHGNFLINTTSLAAGAYYLEVDGYNGASYGNYGISVAGTASGTAGPPVADPPFVTINFIPAGDGGTDVQLNATLTSGAYDGTPEYAWTVDGGALNNASSATPTLTRPTVSAQATYNAELTVTVRGTGTNARSGTSASVTANRDYTVRTGSGPGGGDDHGDSAAAATAITLSGTVAGELETSGDEDWFWFTLNSRTKVVARTAGTTDTTGYLYNSGGNAIARDDDKGPGKNFLIPRELGAGTYFIRVQGWYDQDSDTYETGTYTLSVGPPPANSVPRVTTSRFPTAQKATAGGAALLYRLENAFSDDDGEYLWLAPSSDNETVATVALEGPSLAVYPHSAGEASITMTARDPKGGSVSGSFTLTVSAATTANPTTTFNAAGDKLTLSFSDQFTPNETRAYQTWVRQKSPRGGWNKFCVTSTNSSTSTVTQNASIELPMDGITEPGAVFETQYRHIGSSCNGTPLDKLWSRVAEATAPGTPSFDIDIVWLGSPTAAHRSVMEHAAQQWERIFTMGLPDIDFSGNPGTCGGGDLNDVVDDLRLFVRVQSVDGPGGVLALANACTYRSTSGLPIAGYVSIDADDFPRLGTDGSRRVAAHEIGHALGFLSYQFRRLSLMRKPSLPPHSGIVFDAPDTHFAGEGAIAAFEMAGGASYTDAKVPIENIMGPGSGDSHWRESVLDDELMTPRHDSGSDALSAITLGAMADMGYHVDMSQAESYTLPSARSSSLLGDAIRGGDAQGDSDGQAHEDTDEETDEGWCEVGDDGVIIDDNREIVLTPSAVRMSPINLQ